MRKDLKARIASFSPIPLVAAVGGHLLQQTPPMLIWPLTIVGAYVVLAAYWWAGRLKPRRAIGAIAAVTVVSGLGLWMFGESMFSPCMSERDAFETIKQAEGEKGDSGRKRALNCLVREGASLRYKKMAGAELNFLEVPGGQMGHVRLMDARLHHANFRRAQLDGAAFSQAELNNADFRGAYLGSAFFGAMEIDGRCYRPAEMQGVKFDEDTDLLYANFDGVWSLDCKTLTKAKNWETACRPEALRCGATMPIPDCVGGKSKVCPSGEEPKK